MAMFFSVAEQHQGVVRSEERVGDAGEAGLRLSIFAHGLSAMPGIALYAGKIALLDAAAPEHRGGEI